MPLKKRFQTRMPSRREMVCILIINRTLYLVQDPKTLKKERAKVEEKWKMITKQAQLKNPNFKEPTGKYTALMCSKEPSSLRGHSHCRRT